ncbi:MAG: hypothetical protein AAFV95_02505 [Bacteroidota bacterium]
MKKRNRELIQAFEKKLHKYIKNKRLIKIHRSGAEGEASLHGILLQNSEDFLLLQVEEEFHLNGYAIIRKDRFDGVQRSESERFLQKILTKEGITATEHGLSQKLSLQSFQAIFNDLQQSKQFVIVECEDLKEPSFTIGEIEKTSKKSVGIRYVSPEGLIDRKPTKIAYEDITLIRFGDRYSSLFRKYSREREWKARQKTY